MHGDENLIVGDGVLRHVTIIRTGGTILSLNFIDAEAAEALLKKLSRILNFEINVDKLDERAEETKQMIAKAQQMEQDFSS